MPEHHPPDPGDALEANLGTVTDQEWLEAHRTLAGVLPASEFAYLYDPDRDPATVTRADLTPDPDPAEPGRG